MRAVTTGPRGANVSADIAAVANGRLIGLDVARGLAMLLVCLSHFGDTYLRPLGLERTERLLTLVTLAATPAFILVSGLILGFLSVQSDPDAYARLRLTLVDRALLLLTAARLIIIAAHVPRYGWGGAASIVFITDVVAVCAIVGTLSVPSVPAALRSCAGVLVYAAGTVLVFLWVPEAAPALRLLKHVLVGHQPHVEESTLLYNFPVVQWLGLYLLATGVGEWLGRSQWGWERRFGGLATAGAALVALGALVRAGRPALLHALSSGGQPAPTWVPFATARWQKLPPGPAYVFVYAGLALGLVAACLWVGRARPAAAVTRALALVGRNSLFAFILQYVVYYDVVTWLRLPYIVLWPLLYGATVLFIVAAAWAWQRAGGQRFLTVGYPRLAAWASGQRGASGRRGALHGPVPTPPRSAITSS